MAAPRWSLRTGFPPCGRLTVCWCSTRARLSKRATTALIRLNDGIYRRLFERQALELTKGLVA